MPRRFITSRVTGCIVYKRARFAAGAYFAAYHSVLVVIQIFGLEKRFELVIFYVEGAFGNTLLFFIPQHFGVGAVAHEQTDGAKHDGFTRAGLAGNNVQVPGRVQLQVLDKGVIFNGKVLQHQTIVSRYNSRMVLKG